MANNEKDLEVKLGLDSKPMETGLDRVTSKVSQASTKMATSLDGATKSAEKLGKQLENAGNKTGMFSQFNRNALVTAGIGVGTMAAKGWAKDNLSTQDNASAQSILNAAGIGGMAGMQIGGPWGAVIGALGGAAVGLTQAAENLKGATAEELRNTGNAQHNSRTATEYLKDFDSKTARDEFLQRMGNKDISASARVSELSKAQAEAEDRAENARRRIEKFKNLNGASATLDPSILAGLTKDHATAEAEAKLYEKLQESIGKENKSAKDGSGSRSDVAGMATNDLTRVGLGVNGLNSLNSVQLKANELIQGQTKILEKIEANTKGAKAKWA